MYSVYVIFCYLYLIHDKNFIFIYTTVLVIPFTCLSLSFPPPNHCTYRHSPLTYTSSLKPPLLVILGVSLQQLPFHFDAMELVCNMMDRWRLWRLRRRRKVWQVRGLPSNSPKKLIYPLNEKIFFSKCEKMISCDQK